MIEFKLGELNIDSQGWKRYGIKFGSDIPTEEICDIQIYDGQGNYVGSGYRQKEWAEWALRDLDPTLSTEQLKDYTIKVVTQKPLTLDSTLTVELDETRVTNAREAYMALIEEYEAKL